MKKTERELASSYTFKNPMFSIKSVTESDVYGNLLVIRTKSSEGWKVYYYDLVQCSFHTGEDCTDDNWVKEAELVAYLKWAMSRYVGWVSGNNVVVQKTKTS